MKKERILIVEDEPITAMNERQIIEGLGYTVNGAVNTGEKAIRSILEDTPDLVLMDINLGSGKDGIETAKEIRARFGIPVVFVTAHGNPEILGRAKESEPFGYVLKPFSKEEMSATIEIAIHKHRMEKKLHESEERFRAIADYSYDWEMWLGRNGKLRWINPAVGRMTGYSVSDCLIMADYPLQMVHEEDREIISSHLRKSRMEDYDNDIEFRIACKNGKKLWAAFSYQPIYDMDGKFIGSRWSVRDISIRKKAEEKERLSKQVETIVSGLLKIAMQSIPLEEKLGQSLELIHSLPWFFVLPKGSIFLVNKKTEELILTSQHNLASPLLEICAVVPFGKCLCGRAASTRQIVYADCVDERHETTYDGIQPHGHYCVPIIYRDKLLAVLNLYLAEHHVAPNDYEKVLNIIANTLASTINKARMEEALLEAKIAAESANKAKSEFLAIMSHELRTPLNAINGFSEMMQLETFGPLGNSDYAGYANNIHDAGKHLLQVINDLLDISKIEADAQELEKEEVDVMGIVKDSVELVRGRAQRAGVRLSLNIPKDFPALFADRLRLKQILLNLLTNAIKFTPEQGQITVRASVDGNDAIVLQVQDTGVGIAPEDIPKVFKPFGQVDDIMVRNQEGTGLGIPLTKILVELHGGSLEIESELGKGTTVTVCFPPETIISG